LIVFGQFRNVEVEPQCWSWIGKKKQR